MGVLAGNPLMHQLMDPIYTELPGLLLEPLHQCDLESLSNASLWSFSAFFKRAEKWSHMVTDLGHLKGGPAPSTAWRTAFPDTTVQVGTGTIMQHSVTTCKHARMLPLNSSKRSWRVPKYWMCIYGWHTLAPGQILHLKY
jgi:hypothetical protein